MSEAEASAILGIISEAGKTVRTSEDMFQAALNVKGLPSVLHRAAHYMSLVGCALTKIEYIQSVAVAEYQEPQQDPARKDPIGLPVAVCKEYVTMCRDHVTKIDAIYEQVMRCDDSSSWAERYEKAVQTLEPGKQHRVEVLMGEILHTLTILLRAPTSRGGWLFSELNAASKAMSEVAPSLSERNAAQTFFDNDDKPMARVRAKEIEALLAALSEDPSSFPDSFFDPDDKHPNKNSRTQYTYPRTVGSGMMPSAMDMRFCKAGELDERIEETTEGDPSLTKEDGGFTFSTSGSRTSDVESGGQRIFTQTNESDTAFNVESISFRGDKADARSETLDGRSDTPDAQSLPNEDDRPAISSSSSGNFRTGSGSTQYNAENIRSGKGNPVNPFGSTSHYSTKFGAEPSAVLEIISAILTILDTLKGVLDAVRDARGLPEAFRKIADTMPLVVDTMREADNVQWDTAMDYSEPQQTQSCKDAIEKKARLIKPVIMTCHDNLKELKAILCIVIRPQGYSSALDRYMQAFCTAVPARQRRVEELVREILNNLQSLHEHAFFNEGEARSKELDAAIAALDELPSSLPEEDVRSTSFYFRSRNFHTGLGSIYAVSGSATQYYGNVNHYFYHPRNE